MGPCMALTPLLGDRAAAERLLSAGSGMLKDKCPKQKWLNSAGCGQSPWLAPPGILASAASAAWLGCGTGTCVWDELLGAQKPWENRTSVWDPRAGEVMPEPPAVSRFGLGL